MAAKKKNVLKDVLKSTGEQASEIGRLIVIEQCNKAGLTIPRVLKEIVEGLNAEEVKVSYAAQEGVWTYSKKLKAWQVRQKAVDQAIAVMGLGAPSKVDSHIKSDGPITFQVEFDKKPTDDGK